jgi:hypothetical protein
MATPEKPKEITIETARGRRDFYGLIVAAIFFGVYLGPGLSEWVGGPEMTPLHAILMVAMAIFMIGSIGLTAREEADALKRARAAESEGAIEEATQLLNKLAEREGVRWVRREAEVDLARIAFRAGELGKAEIHLNVAIAGPKGIFGRWRYGQVIEEARSLRALVRAARGDEEGARKDIAEVRKAKGKQRGRGSARGRAALADAIGLERRGDRAGLKALLDRERKRIDKLTEPRERAIAAALEERAHEAEGASVYRQRAPGSQVVVAAVASAYPELDAWVAQILKRAAPVYADPRAPARGLSGTMKKRVAEPRVRVAVEPDREAIEARAEVEAEEALSDEARRRSGPRDA